MLAPLFILALASTVFAAEQRSETVRLPDLSSYDCARVDSATAPGDRHMGQVINGTYYDWHAIYGTIDGKRRLLCISIDRPTARQLNRDEAQQFLSNSFAIGRPNAPTNGTETVETPQEPDDVKPMPLKGVRKPANVTPELQQQQNAEPELPPRPATKSGDDAARQTIKPRAALETQQLETPQTVGVDDRTMVPNTQTFPWNTIGYLSITYPGGSNFRCSGTLVSPYVVLTAGHCIHDQTRGGYVASARFYPGQYQTALGTTVRQPYGGKSDVANFNVTQSWTQISGDDSYPVTDYKHDFASIQFKTPFTFTSTFMPVIYSSNDSPVTNAGYPATVQGSSALGQWTDSGPDISDNFLRNNHVRRFAIDGTGGDSGSPFFFVDPETGQRSVVGSLSYAEDLDDSSGGPWYDSWNKSLLSTWIAWTPTTSTAGSVAGLRAPNVFSTAWKDYQSFVRFYNSSASPGTVEVTLSDVTTGNALATWTSPTIPVGAAPQFYIKTIEDNASPAGFTKPLFYTLSIRPTFSGYFQHVVYQVPQQSVKNWSVCDTGAATIATTLPWMASARLSTFPGSFGIHNTGTSTTSVTIGVYDSDTGTRIGTYTSPAIPANGEAMMHVSDMEASAHITPPANVYRYVLKVESAFTGYLVGYSVDATSNITSDATAMCAMNP